MHQRKKILAARFDPEDAELLAEICKDRGEDVSDFIRRSVLRELGRLGFLEGDKQLQALEMGGDDD